MHTVNWRTISTFSVDMEITNVSIEILPVNWWTISMVSCAFNLSRWLTRQKIWIVRCFRPIFSRERKRRLAVSFFLFSIFLSFLLLHRSRSSVMLNDLRGTRSPAVMQPRSCLTESNGSLKEKRSRYFQSCYFIQSWACYHNTNSLTASAQIGGNFPRGNIRRDKKKCFAAGFTVCKQNVNWARRILRHVFPFERVNRGRADFARLRRPSQRTGAATKMFRSNHTGTAEKSRIYVLARKHTY